MALTILMGMMVAVSCGPAAKEDVRATNPPQLSAPTGLPPIEAMPATPEEIPVGAEAAVELAKEDLAERLRITVEEITVVSVQTSDFPAQNLGCPQPGGKEPEFTIPAFVIGHEVVLRAKGSDYVYRVHGSQVVLCEP